MYCTTNAIVLLVVTTAMVRSEISVTRGAVYQIKAEVSFKSYFISVEKLQNYIYQEERKTKTNQFCHRKMNHSH